MKPGLLEKVCWLGDRYLAGTAVRGVVLRFAGLNGSIHRKPGPDPAELEWAQAGGLVVFPHYNPWAWMNRDTVVFVDLVLDALAAEYGVGRDVPVIPTGGSMGGHAALLYGAQSRHRERVARVLAVSPVCDLVHHYGERPDLPMSLHSAFGSYGDITDALEQHSPLHRVRDLPRVPHLLVHGPKDGAVAKAPHSDRMVAAMRAAGRDVGYIEPAEMEHCGPLDYAAYRATVEFVRAGLLS